MARLSTLEKSVCVYVEGGESNFLFWEGETERESGGGNVSETVLLQPIIIYQHSFRNLLIRGPGTSCIELAVLGL